MKKKNGPHSMEKNNIVDAIVEIQDYIMSFYNPNDPSEAYILKNIDKKLENILKML